MRAVLVLILLLAASAHADAPGRSTVKITIARADPARPIQPGPGGSAISRPELDADQVLSVQPLKGTIRAEQEQILMDLIAHTPDQEVEEKSDYYFRLGQLQAQQHRSWRIKSAALAIQAAQSKDARTQAAAAAAAEKAKQALVKTVKTYNRFTESAAFASYPKMDLALLYYGYTLQGAGQLAEARKVYDQLIKYYPQSPYVPEVYLAFADHLFDAGDLANAESRYSAVLKFPRSAVYWYAMYRMGWVHLRLQRHQGALEAFFAVAQATRNDPQQERLNRASLQDFVRAYAEVGKPDKARPAFLRVDGRRAIDMLQLLADLYLDQGKGDQAVRVYQELVKGEPAHQSVCMWQYNLARATAYNAVRPTEVEICAADVEPLQVWARASGAAVSCASCAGKP